MRFAGPISDLWLVQSLGLGPLVQLPNLLHTTLRRPLPGLPQASQHALYPPPFPALFNQLLSSRSCRPAEGRLRLRAPKHRPPPWPVRAPTRRRTSRRRPVLRAKVRPVPSSSSLGVFRLLLSMRLGETGQLRGEKKGGEEKNSRRARADLPPSAFVFSPLPTAYTPSPYRKSHLSTLIFSLVFSFDSELARYQTWKLRLCSLAHGRDPLPSANNTPLPSPPFPSAA